jgi:hypothetical protein
MNQLSEWGQLLISAFAELKKLHIEGFLWPLSFKKKIPSDYDDMVTRAINQKIEKF